jgi:hypothetical protein
MSDGDGAGTGRHPHHESIHRRFRGALLGFAVTLPLLVIYWFYNRTVACWDHGGHGAFELLLCPNGGIVFGVYALVGVAVLSWVHAPVKGAEPRHDVPPHAGRLPLLGRLRGSAGRAAYAQGFQHLDLHTRQTLLFSEWVVPALIAVALIVVQGLPRILA